MIGIYEFMPDWFKTMFHSNQTELNLMEVQCSSLTNLIGQAGVKFIDFFSLDVEGAELSVLGTLDFSKVEFGIIITEDLAQRTESGEVKSVRQLLTSHGYVYIETFADSNWFVHPRFYDIYSHAIPKEAWERSATLRLVKELTVGLPEGKLEANL